MVGIAECDKSASKLHSKKPGKFSLNDTCLIMEHEKDSQEEIIASFDEMKVGRKTLKDLDLPVLDN
jgi:hypothetical protein